MGRARAATLGRLPERDVYGAGDVPGISALIGPFMLRSRRGRETGRPVEGLTRIGDRSHLTDGLPGTPQFVAERKIPGELLGFGFQGSPHLLQVLQQRGDLASGGGELVGA